MKQVERWEVSNIERELSLRTWLRRREIGMVLFDWDDTIGPTIPIFREYVGKCCDFLATVTGKERRVVQVCFERHNNECFEQFGVNPKRWIEVIARVSDDFGICVNEGSRAMEILGRIYSTPTVLFDGVIETLKMIQRADVGVGIVTHANAEWTRKKYGWTGLGKVVDWNDIYIVDENGHKGMEEWRKAVEYFRMNPRNIMSCGDSPRTDIRPGWELGFAQVAWVSNGVGGRNGWGPHQMSMDPKTIEISGVARLADLGKEVIDSYKFVGGRWNLV